MQFSWMTAFIIPATFGKVKKFRRESWEAPHSKYISFFDNELHITLDDGHTWLPYQFTNDDILATDWKVMN